ncbi:hypothetical protein FGB62_129g010 [Gracilaria domingensis]|nr:hypothetical protein FGB62_129g010 [Gracilaria domingensis]
MTGAKRIAVRVTWWSDLMDSVSHVALLSVAGADWYTWVHVDLKRGGSPNRLVPSQCEPAGAACMAGAEGATSTGTGACSLSSGGDTRAATFRRMRNGSRHGTTETVWLVATGSQRMPRATSTETPSAPGAMGGSQRDGRMWLRVDHVWCAMKNGARWGDGVDGTLETGKTNGTANRRWRCVRDGGIIQRWRKRCAENGA